MALFVAAVNLLIIAGISFFVWRQQTAELRFVFWPALIFRLSAGIALGIVYRFYYPVGDTFGLFDQSAVATRQFYEHPLSYLNFLWSNSSDDYKGILRSVFFIKLISIVNIVTYSSYWITGLWLSLLTFFCSWKLVKTVSVFFDGSLAAAAFAFLFFPSAVFWSSGIIKESPALAALFLLAVTWLNLMKGKRPGILEILLDLIALWVLWNLKYYWAAVFLPVAAASAIIRFCFGGISQFSVGKTVTAAVLIALLCFTVTLLHPNFHVGYFLTVLVNNHDSFVRLSATESMIHYYDLRPDWMSIVINSPWALVSGLFRPMIGEPVHGLAFLASVENAIVLVFFLAAVIKRKWQTSPERLIIFSVAIYTIILCVFLAISTPNFGSLARYKSGFMPFFVFLIGYGAMRLKEKGNPDIVV